MKPSHRFFQNVQCEYFPCHQGLDPAEFNCLFCFCPLYFLPDCGGNFILRSGIKDCTGCIRPHRPGGYDEIIARLRAEAARARDADLSASGSERTREG
ncbi:metal-binding protein [Desulfovibrio sulfodismutans]|uniref:Metal-binding protein n=1 Tax=Desulfolutivibrio sulfodismutans TaxID=63561 RepID=A0A7K3NPD8_9BACT|nr:cysteine-rich small domain-containing protein [Desulfolutivibrio sulfodismutans]NDY58058.1 metal-binding protein [Desulfolutivibrio sulfodismutans]QLA13649.1 metal-binding protein [Desulfolutivibrio sulfodismutans DSM 3696]